MKDEINLGYLFFGCKLLSTRGSGSCACLFIWHMERGTFSCLEDFLYMVAKCHCNLKLTADVDPEMLSDQTQQPERSKL